MRDNGGEDLFQEIMTAAEALHTEHMSCYGTLNERRMTGTHETASYENFSYGVSSRGASVRIPSATAEDEWKGYAEDRRPASNCDPYRVADCVLQYVR